MRVEVIRVLALLVLTRVELQDVQLDLLGRRTAVVLDQLVRRVVDVVLVDHQPAHRGAAHDHDVAGAEGDGAGVPPRALQRIVVDVEIHPARAIARAGFVAAQRLSAVEELGPVGAAPLPLGARDVDHGAVGEEGPRGAERVAFRVQLPEGVGAPGVFDAERVEAGPVVLHEGVFRVGAGREVDAGAAVVLMVVVEENDGVCEGG
ncbi:hypothetical protein Tdes44962_MAKER07355 [Teratosphaeria destructans]|uniref:Secreted protein n=1 Tax=Teratosphaeria destructans TaxID=418781 RepID=A0A9W7SZ96_9PEZI|nr:hypothetical protein Tdes44962_MAKER07355 [Teratosphaeria destructans]